MPIGMYRVWRYGRVDHLEAAWCYLPYAERIDMWNGTEWVTVMLDYKWVEYKKEE